MPEESNSGKKITKDGLILAELKGKNEAIGRYDTILWRIRSGYVVVLYGSLLLFTGKEGGVTALFEKTVMVWAASITVFLLSFILACIDAGFRLRQLTVVDAYNRLSDIAYAFAADKEVQFDDFRSLLHITGEGENPNVLLRRTRTVVLIGLLYLGPPSLALLGLVAYIFTRGAWG